MISDRYIEIYTTNSEELIKFKKIEIDKNENKNKPIPRDKDSIVLKLTGLPWDTNYSDIKNFLIDVPLIAVHFPRDKYGRPNGKAFIEVADEEFCVRTIGHSKEFIGKRFIEIKRCQVSELLFEMGSTAKNEQIKETKTHCVMIQNLSPSTSNFGIDQFFAKDFISPFRIHKKVQGTEAFCEFVKKTDYLRALQCNGKELNGKYIVVSKVSYEKVVRIVGLEVD